jgi:diketogulonate reductase-like aldo/keto reductase
MINRRQFLEYSGSAAFLSALPVSLQASEFPQIEQRAIPCGCGLMPIVGLGNSNAFRQGDLETSARIIQTLHDHGGAYIDCGGESSFVVGQTVDKLGVSGDMFLGSYFSGGEDEKSRQEAARLMKVANRTQLDLMHSIPEDAEPNWETFRAWKDDGLTQYIGIARHRMEHYPAMMRIMKTGTCDFLQVNYSLLETEAEEEVLPMAMDEGVAVTINRPFINGEFFKVVKGHELPEWAAEFDCHSWAQFSLKFILSHPAVHCVLTETANPKHLLDNIGGGIGRMPDEKTRQRMLETIRTLA